MTRLASEAKDITMEMIVKRLKDRYLCEKIFIIIISKVRILFQHPVAEDNFILKTRFW